MPKRPYTSIYDWMERTGTTQNELAQRTRIKRSFLSLILSRGRRCSYDNALKLSGVTGVPVEKLFDRPKRDGQSTSETAA